MREVKLLRGRKPANQPCFTITLDNMNEYARKRIYCPPGDVPNVTGLMLFRLISPVILTISWPFILLFRWWFR